MAGTNNLASAAPNQMSGKQTLATYNQAARQAIIKGAIKKKIQIFSQTAAPSTFNNVINIGGNNVRMAGLLTKFIVEVTATFNLLASGTVVETQIGRANILSNVQFTDLQSNQRHNCSGAQLALVASRKRRRPYGANIELQSSLAGNNVGAASTPTPISVFTVPTTTVVGALRQVYEIPVSVDDHDLTGSIFLGVYGAQLSLQLTVNPNPLAASGDSTFACAFGSGATFNAAQISTITVTVYQEFYDQLPTNPQGAFVLPPLDISSVYQLTYSNFTGMTANQEFTIPYANYRKYLSQTVIYNNSGADGGLSQSTTDVAYWALVSANFTYIFKVDPLEQKRVMRELFGTDFWFGLYVFDTASKPVDTQNYGNLQLVLNAITAGTSAYGYTMSEFIAYQQQIAQAPSMPANA